MKKLSAIIISIALVFTLCACQPTGDDVSDTSSYSEPAHSSEISDTTSETEEPTVSETESSDDTSTIIESTPSETTSSKPIAETSSKEEVKDVSSKEEVSEEESKEPINFVPSATKYYFNNVFYKGVKYASIMGKNNGVDCFAVVTLDSNDEYLNCVYVFDGKNSEQAVFNINNDRIYFLQYVVNDDRDYVLLNDYSICSVNLSGDNKKIEKKVTLPFTHISAKTDYANSKYLFFNMTNIFDAKYDVIYRYNTETNELDELKHRINTHAIPFSIGERVFVWNPGTQEIYEHDVDFAIVKYFYTVDDPHRINSLGVELKENGFLLYHHEREDKYLLDFSGNVSKK